MSLKDLYPIILTALISFLGFYKNLDLEHLKNWRELRKWKNWKKIKAGIWVGALFSFFTFLQIISTAREMIQNKEKQKFLAKVNATFGDIQDLYGTPITKMRIGLNTKGIYAIESSPGKNDGIYSIDGKFIMKLCVKNNKLSFTTVIRTSMKETIATINDNQWEWIDDDGKRYDYNYNDTSFEVVTKGDRRVYLQVELTGGVVGIAGLLVNEDGNGILLGTSPNNPDRGIGFKNGAAISGVPYVFPFQFIDTPIFKYPRKRYPGVRASETE